MPVARSKGTTRPSSAVTDVHIVWITAGLGCDGDSVSVTAAEQPSIEDVLLGAIPGLPKVHLHNPVLAYENGDEFMKFYYQAEKGEIDPFVLVVEGSIPNEKIKKEGYWAAVGTNPDTGQPIPTCDWIDRLAPKALAVIAIGTCATYGGIHAMEGNPTGCMGLADYLGWGWRSKAGLPIVNVPGCPVQPDNFMETVLYLLYQVAGMAPMIPPPNTAAQSAWSSLAAGVPSLIATSPSADGCAGSGDAPTWVASASAAQCQASRISSCLSWTSRPEPRSLPRPSACMAT